MPTDNNNKKQNQAAQPDNPLDDTLAWLEALALDEVAEDAPKTEEVADTKEPETPQQPTADAQLQWLDALASEDDAIEEQPTLSWEHTKPTNDLLSPSLPLTNEEDTGSEGWATAWLEDVDQDEETSLEELENLLLEEEPASAPKPPDTLKKTEVTSKKKSSGGMFGADEDFTISAEEIAAAAASGMEVDGFDFPDGDDDEAAMAWLEGLIGDDAGEPELVVADVTAEEESTDGAELDDLFAIALEQDSQPIELPEADDVMLDGLLAELEPEPEPPVVEAPPADPPAKKKSSGGMFGADEDFTISAEEIAAAAASGMEVDGFDFPDGDDDEAALAWLEGLIGDDTGEPELAVADAMAEETPEDALDDLFAVALEQDSQPVDLPEADDGMLDDLLALASDPEPEPEPQMVETPPADPPAKKKSGGGMFGADEDFTISAEEIAAAAAGGMEVDGFDFPDGDDDEAALAWLEGLIGDDAGEPDLVMADTAAEEAPEEVLDDLFAVALEQGAQGLDLPNANDDMLDDLLALASEPDPEPEPQMVETPPADPPAKKKSGGGMFGADEDFTISEEEIAAAAAGGMEVDGFDFPDGDDEAALAWLEGLIDEVPEMDEIPSTANVTDVVADPPSIEENVVVEDEPESLFMEENTSLFDDLLFADDDDDDAITVTNPDEALQALLALADEQDEQEEVEEPVLAPALLEEAGDPLLDSVLDPAMADDGDDEDDPLSWLQMEDDDSFSSEEETSLTDELLALDADQLEAAAELSDSMLDPSEIDDPDGALSWLTDSGDDDDADLSLLDGLDGAEIDEDVAVPNFDFDQELPDDPDEAMRLLEQLAADQDDAAQEELGTPLAAASPDLLGLDDVDESDISFEQEESVAVSSLFDEDVVAEQSAADASDTLFAQEDDLLDDGFDSDVLEGLDLGDGDADSLSWLDDTGEFDQLPEDPDEAMAMLEQLSSDMDDAGDNLDFDPLEFEDDIDELIELAEEAGDPSQDPTAVDELFPEAVSSALPEWFAMGGSETGDTFASLDWLGTEGGGDGGILGWLESEEEVGQRSDTLTSASILDGLDILDNSSATRERETTPQMRQPEVSPQEATEVIQRPEYDPAIFRPARAMISAGDMDGALEEYTDFMKDRNQALILVDELEQVVNTVTKHPLLQRLLGDAYMRSGQLQEALDMYSLARDQL